MLSLFTSLGLIKDSQSPLSKIPNYASLVFIELLKDSENKYFVQFSFKNSSLEVSLFSLYVYGNQAFSLEWIYNQTRPIIRYISCRLFSVQEDVFDELENR